ncbi:MAG: threonine synthase [Solirubrobacteraceae bacterium]|nr:threonine synthase [Solirubrobacteraceae bacterium]
MATEPRPESLPLADVRCLSELGEWSAADGASGLWRYRDAIPVDPALGARLSMGEGLTPLIASGQDGVSVKLEFLSPTGSFKDRGAVVLVARALARGAPSLVADSSGNAGSAIAAYAARAGLTCRVFVPEGTSAAKQAQIGAYGATLAVVPGDRTATAQRAWAAVAESGATYASHVYDPYFLQGTRTFAFEIWEQLATAPDALVIPAGNGTLLLGTWIGFSELHAAGLIARMPALVAVQSERCAPLAAAFARGADEPLTVAARPTAAEGIAIPRPARGAEMLAAIRASGGTVVAVPEAAIAPARRDLAARGLLVEPTAAAAWAALGIARELPALGPWAGVESEPWARARSALGGTVVVPLCGSGLKSAE